MRPWAATTCATPASTDARAATSSASASAFPPPAWICADRLGELARVASREHDVSALGGERARDREADPARGARHQRYPAFEKTHHPSAPARRAATVASSESGPSTFSTRAPFAIFRTSPLSTLPGAHLDEAW